VLGGLKTTPVGPLRWDSSRGAVGTVTPKHWALGAEEFPCDVASKGGCQGDATVGYGNVETLPTGDRPDEGVAVERQGSHAWRRFNDRRGHSRWDENPSSRE
jgi:hypothetical protein